ncbi:hypothetical protein CFIMG_002200RA [Ceratocystis fimbriata CBS 114723]|uniref:DUF3074 domain-containing protein n=1 Tax=Ceratocystis fimbriata CBS 114723 TaxID=1035309 RepID=A0A2C5X4P5_9PEZI|nr:hypothetical protein CFIMG_002200RA [Ceratocystis fimbriata CBS 114723]
MTSQAIFHVLEPIEWDDISHSADFTDILDDTIFHGRSIIASLPAAAAPPAKIPLDGHVRLMVEGLRREWKEVKGASGKDDQLGIAVYRLPAADNKGTWFGRQSVDTRVPFDRWKNAFMAEFPEALRTGQVIRGLSAQEQLEDLATDSCHVQVLRMGAQFPGPTAPRDFVAMVLTCESSALSASTQSATATVTSDATATPTSGRLLRELIVVSKPCDHPASPPVHGTIRGFYESVESIREIEGADGHIAVEWAMVTRSNPGGNVPRFMIERGTPSAICGDAVKFYKWMETVDLSAYEHPPETATNGQGGLSTNSSETLATEKAVPTAAAAEHDSRHAFHSLYPTDQQHNHSHSYHNSQYDSSHLSSPPGSSRRSIQSMRSIADTLEGPPPTFNAACNSTPSAYDSDDDDNESFISALSEPEHFTPSPPSPHRPSSSIHSYNHTPERLSTDAPMATHNGYLSPHRANYTFPIMKTHGTDSLATPPRLSAEWMASTEEIAAAVANSQGKDRLRNHLQNRRQSAHMHSASMHTPHTTSPRRSQSQHRPRRATTPSTSSTQLAASPQRQYAASASAASISSASGSSSRSRSRSDSKSSAAPNSSSGGSIKKEHRSLADRLLHRTPSKSKAARKEAERQRKQEAKARRAAEKREEREMKQGIRARHEEEKKARRAAAAALKTQKDASHNRQSSSEGSMGKENNYGTSPAGIRPGRAAGTESVPRSVAGGLGSARPMSAVVPGAAAAEDPRVLKLERDTLKEQVARLRNQNALLAGRLGQLGLEDDEIKRLAALASKPR